MTEELDDKFDEMLMDVWQHGAAQHEEGGDLKRQIKGWAEAFNRRIFWRNLIEYAAGVDRAVKQRSHHVLHHGLPVAEASQGAACGPGRECGAIPGGAARPNRRADCTHGKRPLLARIPRVDFFCGRLRYRRCTGSEHDQGLAVCSGVSPGDHSCRGYRVAQRALRNAPVEGHQTACRKLKCGGIESVTSVMLAVASTGALSWAQLPAYISRYNATRARNSRCEYPLRFSLLWR